MVDEVGAETTAEVSLGYRHSDTRGESLTEGPGRRFDTQLVIDLGVARGVAIPLSEVAEVVEGQAEPGKMEDGVQEHRPVSVGENEPVSIGPFGVVGVDVDEPRPEGDRNVGHSHWHSRMTGVGPLDRVHRQGLDRVDCQLLS